MRIRALQQIHGSYPSSVLNEKGKPVARPNIVRLQAGEESEVSDDYGNYLVNELGYAEVVN